jgi:hypothetical protein
MPIKNHLGTRYVEWEMSAGRYRNKNLKTKTIELEEKMKRQ